MKMISIALLMTSATLANLAAASEPVKDVSRKQHPNLAAAQQLSRQAYNRIVAAQRANEWDLGGHAQKAKELLDQVNVELKEAALTANRK